MSVIARLRVLASVAAPILAAACGDGDDGSSTIDTGGKSASPEPSATATSTASSAGDAAPPPTTPPPPAAIHLLGCFTHADDFDTCQRYCTSISRSCVERGCNGDGSLLEGSGYTWVSWSASEAAECDALGYPDQMSFDACTTPIWLQPTKPRDDIVRCCCR